MLFSGLFYGLSLYRCQSAPSLVHELNKIQRKAEHHHKLLMCVQTENHSWRNLSFGGKKVIKYHRIDPRLKLELVVVHMYAD
jgi:hypothetical protein